MAEVVIHSVILAYLWLHGLQQPRLPCSSLSPRSLLKFMFIELVMLSISSSAAPFSFCLQFFPASGPFPMTLRIRWPKYWNFGFNNSPSIEYSRLISFWMDWFDIPSPHPKYHLQLGQKKMLGVVVWDCKGEENSSHGDGKANVWKTNVWDNGRQLWTLI